MVGSPTLLGSFVPHVLQAGGLATTMEGKLLVALVALALVIFVGRVVLGIAWTLVRIGIVVVGALWLASVAAPTLL